MIRDKKSEKYLGILEISNDLLNIEDRDKFIGWNKNIQKDKINIDRENLSKARSSFLVNITCCIGLQPMAYNLNIGKLLVKTVFSREVFKHFYDNRGYYYAGVTTFGLYGKSIQYDRLKELKFVGYTKGNSVYKFPSEFVKQCKTYLQDYYKTSPNKKLHIISTTLQKLKLPKDEFMSANPKGVYFGFIYSDAKDLLCNKIDNIKDIKLPSINDIFNDWLNRWAKQRYNNLITNNKFIEYVKMTSKDRTKKSLDKLKEKIGIDEFNKRSKKYYKSKKKINL
jgi:hypothetical protein